VGLGGYVRPPAIELANRDLSKPTSTPPGSRRLARNCRTASTGGDGVRHHFSSSSLILSPPLATGTTQTDVASADELRRVI
jgi:hypothetical protein